MTDLGTPGERSSRASAINPAGEDSTIVNRQEWVGPRANRISTPISESTMHRVATGIMTGIMVSAILACHDPANESPVPATSAVGMSVATVAPQAQEVTGTATTRYPFSSAYTESFSFNAVRHKDGTVSGHFAVREYDFETGQAPLRFHGRVTCFEVVGSVVYLEGIATGNTPDIPTDSPLSWSVRDNGSGKSTLPDMASNFEGSAGNCVGHFLEPTLVLKRGDIRIRQ